MTTYAETDFNLTAMTVKGINLPMKKIEGINHNFWSFAPDNMKEHLKQLKCLEIREDDVFICTYPRSRTNWVHEIVQMLINKSSNYGPLFGVVDHFPIKNIMEMKHPRVLCSHLPFEFLPTQLNVKGKIICVFRNPKDVAVSVHNFMKHFNFVDYNATWDEFLGIFLDGEGPSGSWFKHVSEWASVINANKERQILTLYYEDLKLNLIKGIQKISDFLGLLTDHQLISEITKKCEFKTLQKEKFTNVPKSISEIIKGTPNHMYRKGEIGDWKNWFTVAQDELFDTVYWQQMKNCDLTFRFTK